MRSPLIDQQPRWRRALSSGGVLFSVGAHVLFALWLVGIDVDKQVEEIWVEMAVVSEPKPEEPPPPEPPPPEPPKPKVVPEAVKFKDMLDAPPPDAPPPDAPPPEQRKPVRLTQGLSASSFAEGSGTGVNARAGNSTSVAAGKDTMTIDEATGPFVSQPYASVTTKPRMKSVPPVEVPAEAQKAEVQGSWTILLDIDVNGAPTSATFGGQVGFGVEEACVAAWMRSRWKPGLQDGVPVPVKGIPMKCVIKIVE